MVPEDSENLFGVRQIPNFSVMHCGQFESQAIINVHRRKCIDFEGNDSPSLLFQFKTCQDSAQFVKYYTDLGIPKE